MFAFFRNLHKLPPLSAFPLKSYHVNFSLDRLRLGVDNIRYDVLLSPAFCHATRKIIAQLLKRHAGLEKRGDKAQPVAWTKEVSAYQQHYKEIRRDAVNKAKASREIQINFLAQTALIKMLLDEVRDQYALILRRIKKKVRKSDLAIHNDLAEAPKLKDKLARLQQNREAILKKVGMEICGFWGEIEQKEIQPMTQTVFGNKISVFNDLLSSPILHVENPHNELFLISDYDLALGRRLEDPDKYDTLLFFIRYLLNQIDLQDSASEGMSAEQRLNLPPVYDEEAGDYSKQAYNKKIEEWLHRLGNMDLLFNFQFTKVQYQSVKKKKTSSEELQRLQTLIRSQKKLLHFFYRQFRYGGLIERIAASYEMQPEYLEYCPPLIPQQIIQYLVLPKSRRVIKNRLKRLTKVFGRSFSLRPLKNKIKAIEHMTVAKRKIYLIRYLNAFAHFHRDISNLHLMRDAMERINLTADEKVVILSRENHSLYEFLQPHERTSEEAPIINHVVVKADVRGSTDITYQMNAKGLNPASYFSLNVFDPISEVLSEYDAVKVFIEGDAIILSIFERKNIPGEWFGVARACGIALNMLAIIKRYNEKSKRYQLPILELGIGVSYLDKAPGFLFDGNDRIMISPAINQADRLSSCSKIARRLLTRKKRFYNLYVFQTLPEKEMTGTVDDLFMRYNINGIELSPAGFEKLSNEIDLRLIKGKFSDSFSRKTNIYCGRFPTKSGRYQRLIIRETQVPVVDPTTMKTVRISSRKYYEVCTHPKLYQIARQMDAR